MRRSSHKPFVNAVPCFKERYVFIPEGNFLAGNRYFRYICFFKPKPKPLPMNRFSNLFLTLMLGLLAVTACKKEAAIDYKRTDNTAIIRLRVEPGSLHPVLVTDNYGRQLVMQMFMYLITLDPETYEYIPFLAKARPVVAEITEGPYAGGLSYTFEIHDEAVWDDGTPVTGHDYVFSLKAVLNPLVPAQRLRPYLAFIKDVQVDADNPKKFTVFTNEKYILGEEAVSSTFVVMPEAFYDPEGFMKTIALTDLTDPEKAAALAQNEPRLQQFAGLFSDPKYAREKGFISGCGPYQFEEWQTGQKIILTKKANWWGDALANRYRALRAYPDRYEYLPVGEDATAVAAMRAEDMDVVTDIPTKDFLELREDPYVRERFNFYTPTMMAYAVLYMNNKNPKLADKRVRRAIAHAINVDEIIETIYDGFGQRAIVPLNPGAVYYNKNLQPVPFDIAAARKLLSEAGWEDTNKNGTVDKEINGERVELSLSCFVAASSETGRNALLLAQEGLRQAGITLEIVPQEFAVFMDEVRRENYEMASGGRTILSSLWDPFQDWHSESASGGDNHNKFRNAAADKLIEEIRVTLDEGKRNDLYRQLQAIIYEEQPGIFLFHRTATLAIHKRFEAISFSDLPNYVPGELRLNVK